MGVYRLTDFSTEPGEFTYALEEENIPSVETCFIDRLSVESLGKVIEGPITNFSNLIFAELYVRALIFHQTVRIIGPAVQVTHILSPKEKPFYFHSGVGKFKQFESIDEIFKKINHNSTSCQIDRVFTFKDEKIEREIVEEQNKIHLLNKHIINQARSRDGFLMDTRLGRFEQICDSLEEYGENIFWKDDYLISKFLKGIPRAKLPTYLSDPVLCSKIGTSTLNGLQEFLLPIENDWKKVEKLIKYHMGIPFPPFLSIVFHRAENRKAIVDSILELRNDFEKARIQLWENIDDAILRSEKDIFKTHRILDEISKQARTIIPRALHENAEKRNFVLQFINAAFIMFKLNNGKLISPNEIMKLLADIKNLFCLQAPSLISKNIESFLNNWDLLEKHFSPSELLVMRQTL